MAISIVPLATDAAVQALPALSALRCRVFRDWPYLYDGHPDYEAAYLAEFAASPNAFIVAAYDDQTIVGAATAAPLSDHTSAFAPLFTEHGFDPETVYYLGESVLLPEYRGRGIGHAFFDAREAQAASLRTRRGNRFETSAFCGVIRDAADRRCPSQYRALDPFWEKRGYKPVPGMIGNYDWQEVGADYETRHPMQFWARAT